MSRDQKISRIGALLGNLAGEKEWRDRLAMHALFLSWPELVGADIAEVAWPEVIRERVLWIRVADPVWRQQLVFEKTALLREINRRLHSKEKIEDIRFRLDGSLEREAEGRAAATAARPLPITPPSPDPAEEAEFVRLISVIDDPEARANLLRLWRKAAAGRRCPEPLPE